MLNLAVRKETARLQKVNGSPEQRETTKLVPAVRNTVRKGKPVTAVRPYGWVTDVE
jgi:hypothetical protein